MIYAYIRVSTDKQSVENQRFEIKQFCAKHDMRVDRWIDETTSGTKDVDERKLGLLLREMEKGDVLICSELSRLGRNLLMGRALGVHRETVAKFLRGNGCRVRGENATLADVPGSA